MSVREAEAKANVPEQQMEKQAVVDKQVSHLVTCSEQAAALLLPATASVYMRQHQDGKR